MLLEEGLTVHAAVRDPANQKKIGHLNKVAIEAKGKIKYFKTDLLEMGSYDEAMEGCELVYHTASPFATVVKDPQKDLVDPAVLGTKNVLDSASMSLSVKRVVVTSSVASICGDVIDCLSAPNGILTEEIWNTTSSLTHQPYSYSKTMAEKKAWEISKTQSNWDLVTINPSFVLGPPLNPQATTSESFSILKQFGDGTMKMGVPKMGIGVVDVRDVAEAHYQGGFNPNAEGRYITSGHDTNFLEMSAVLLSKYGDKFPLPTKLIPKWLLMIVGPMTNKLFTWKFIRRNVGVELGITFRSLKETMEDGFKVLVDEKILQPQ